MAEQNAFEFQLIVSGVAAALRYVSAKSCSSRPSPDIFKNPLFDERCGSFGNDPLQFFSKDAQSFRTAPMVAFRSMVNDLSTNFDLTTEELATAYYHFENVIRKLDMKTAPFYAVRPLFVACVSVAIKTLDDSGITVAEISEVLSELGYNVTPSKVGQMECALLSDGLNFDIHSFTMETFDIYKNALINEGISLQPTAYSEAG